MQKLDGWLIMCADYFWLRLCLKIKEVNNSYLLDSILSTGGPHVGHHVGAKRAPPAGSHPESVRAGASPVAGSGLVPPGGEGPGLQDQHPQRWDSSRGFQSCLWEFRGFKEAVMLTAPAPVSTISLEEPYSLKEEWVWSGIGSQNILSVSHDKEKAKHGALFVQHANMCQYLQQLRLAPWIDHS